MEREILNELKKLPREKVRWMGGRRPCDIRVGDLPNGADMCVWLDEVTEFVRAGTIAPRGDEVEALAALLIGAMLEPLPGARPCRPHEIAVENPTEGMRGLCAELGIKVTTRADFSPVDELVAAASSDVGHHQLDYLPEGTAPPDVQAFLEAASSFHRAAPWKSASDQEPLRVEGLAVSPLFVILLGNAGIETGAVLCLTEAVTREVLRGKTFTPDGPARPLLFFSWIGADEAGERVFAQAREHGWPLKPGADVPMLMSYQQLAHDVMPSADELRLVTAALQAVAKVSLKRGPVEKAVSLPGGEKATVHWPVEIHAPARATSGLLQFKIELVDTDIFRRIVVADDISLTDLHHAIQDAMGWGDEHLWAFYRGRETFDDEDADDVLLNTLKLRVGSKLEYEYDMGDGWQHVLKLEKRLKSGDAPTCIEGFGACPPEDCGGVGGYLSLLAALENRRHPAHKDAQETLGKKYDSAHFDLAAAQRRMKRDHADFD